MLIMHRFKLQVCSLAMSLTEFNLKLFLAQTRLVLELMSEYN